MVAAYRDDVVAFRGGAEKTGDLTIFVLGRVLHPGTTNVVSVGSPKLLVERSSMS